LDPSYKYEQYILVVCKISGTFYLYDYSKTCIALCSDNIGESSLTMATALKHVGAK
jgi:hypothetical protein